MGGVRKGIVPADRRENPNSVRLSFYKISTIIVSRRQVSFGHGMAIYRKFDFRSSYGASASFTPSCLHDAVRKRGCPCVGSIFYILSASIAFFRIVSFFIVYWNGDTVGVLSTSYHVQVKAGAEHPWVGDIPALFPFQRLSSLWFFLTWVDFVSYFLLLVFFLFKYRF